MSSSSAVIRSNVYDGRNAAVALCDAVTLGFRPLRKQSVEIMNLIDRKNEAAPILPYVLLSHDKSQRFQL